MKHYLRLALLVTCAASLTSCANRYELLMSNGMSATSKTKPKLTPDGVYIITDPSGNVTTIPAGRVRGIEVH